MRPPRREATGREGRSSAVFLLPMRTMTLKGRTDAGLTEEVPALRKASTSCPTRRKEADGHVVRRLLDSRRRVFLAEVATVERRNALHGRRRARLKDGLWLLLTALLALPLVADRVSGWFLRGVAGITGLSG